MQMNDRQVLLDLISQPVLCVQDGVITQLNQSAKQMQLVAGTPIRELLLQDCAAYDTFQGGNLYLRLWIAGIPSDVCVTRNGDWDLFLLEVPDNNAQLQALALAAQQLRMPLSNIMVLTEHLLSAESDHKNNDSAQHIGQINKNLFQLLRQISNMSDANRCFGSEPANRQTVNFSAFFDETVKSAQVNLEQSGITLHYSGLSGPVFGLAAEELLERAVYNLISNAAKFSPRGEIVEASLTQANGMLHFTIQNSGEIPPDVQANIFSRYTRTPAIEDSRQGLGIGLSLVRAAAAAHNGTVLIDHPQSSMTRVTLTLRVQQDTNATVRTPIIRMHDYAGGRNHSLLELAEVLTANAYKQE